MRRSLRPHPDTPCEALTSIDVDVARPGPLSLRLTYQLAGRMSEVRLPEPEALSRSDRLWEHSCLELFIRPEPGEAYHEFNFAPSLSWASYRLSGYRSGMHQSLELQEPLIEVGTEADRYRMQVSLDLSRLRDLPPSRSWRLGISAIVEEVSGRKSYWALRHPNGDPDFHHKDCFALQLAAADHP